MQIQPYLHTAQAFSGTRHTAKTSILPAPVKSQHIKPQVQFGSFKGAIAGIIAALSIPGLLLGGWTAHRKIVVDAPYYTPATAAYTSVEPALQNLHYRVTSESVEQARTAFRGYLNTIGQMLMNSSDRYDVDQFIESLELTQADRDKIDRYLQTYASQQSTQNWQGDGANNLAEITNWYVDSVLIPKGVSSEITMMIREETQQFLQNYQGYDNNNISASTFVGVFLGVLTLAISPVCVDIGLSTKRTIDS